MLEPPSSQPPSGFPRFRIWNNLRSLWIPNRASALTKAKRITSERMVDSTTPHQVGSVSVGAGTSETNSVSDRIVKGSRSTGDPKLIMVYWSIARD